MTPRLIIGGALLLGFASVFGTSAEWYYDESNIDASYGPRLSRLIQEERQATDEGRIGDAERIHTEYREILDQHYEKGR